MSDNVGTDAVTFRYLVPGEAAVLTEAIRAAYGDSYDVRWVYDRDEVESRLAAGTYVSCAAESVARLRAGRRSWIRLSQFLLPFGSWNRPDPKSQQLAYPLDDLRKRFPYFEVPKT